MSHIALEQEESEWLSGKSGQAKQLAMRLVLRAAEIMGAESLIPIGFAHLDACFYTGQAHVDFAQFLLDHRARFAVPTWTNVGLVSLEDPTLRPEAHGPEMVQGAKRLMQIYALLGAKPVWTCAPYQLPGRPKFGDHIVAGESNAVSFYNAVLGARTNKYGDYLDVACAMIGKAPRAGLHLDHHRTGEVHFETAPVPEDFKRKRIFHHLLGYHIGKRAGQRIPVISGLPRECSEDDLKAISAAVAASGGVEMWHGVGVTPEAPDLDRAFGGKKPSEREQVTAGNLLTAHRELCTGRDGPLAMVALGTPHFSLAEFAELTPLLAGRSVRAGLRFYISTSRMVRDLAQAKGWIDVLERAGATIVVDTCTYYSPAVRGAKGRVMTNAAKWAYYAPGLLGVETIFGSLEECVESAVRGEVWRDPELWSALA
jgi:predicted aconitase